MPGDTRRLSIGEMARGAQRPQSTSPPDGANHSDGNGSVSPPSGGVSAGAPSPQAAATDLQSSPTDSSNLSAGGQDHPVADSTMP